MPALNRKTTVPIDSSPAIVKWLIKNLSKDELIFMAELARNRQQFTMLKSILTKLTDYNVYDVFYESNIGNGEDLRVFRAAKRGEVAGLKAFQMACVQAREKVATLQEKAHGGK